MRRYGEKTEEQKIKEANTVPGICMNDDGQEQLQARIKKLKQAQKEGNYNESYNKTTC